MTGPKAASRLDKALRFALSVLVLLPAAFSAGASAQEIRIERVGLSAPVDGAGAAAALPAGGALIGAGVVSAAPSVLSPSIEPGAVPVAAAAAGA
ncbi:MAG TPA: hypothetical protein VH309_08995, partial [Elusimicrobiota bacterium]|nr:hypothetical protein [Elusimicrobiota bacterium]